MNRGTHVGRERLALCLPLFQLIGAELDDLVQLVRLAVGIALIPFQIKKYVTHGVTLQQIGLFVNETGAQKEKRKNLKISVDKWALI